MRRPPNSGWHEESGYHGDYHALWRKGNEFVVIVYNEDTEKYDVMGGKGRSPLEDYSWSESYDDYASAERAALRYTS